ncbi:CaiB/BaiF CoA transferase family protein [Streptacidiphilus carbonis]|uniref:CaiB/BaiF CoA transferase family protein n=1 Tax=Streptacidiphilus carbonis TaxID=105422 RepID=UPI0005A6AAA2|nr:CaiB/BaiF CoA-transferase family protein [Streptacidiphilus carbonis]
MSPEVPTESRGGPLAGLRVVELGGIGPGPFCGMLLADLGAEVVRIDRPERTGRPVSPAMLHRGRRSAAVDLKHPEGARTVLRLIERADAVLEGFRPGVAERLGLGPEDCLARNPRLVYGRMTGWGQQGPWAQQPGHDINYIALSGALHAVGAAGGDPVVPLNLVGDFGGGGMLLAFGMTAALLQVARGGPGQVVDAAMTDGSALLMAMAYGFLGQGAWHDERGSNLLDGGAPFYRVYRCADGRHVAVGALEPQFYTALLDGLGLADDPDLAAQHDREQWPVMHAKLAAAFAAADRDHWARRFAGTQACVTPVLSLTEAPQHPHNQARNTFRSTPDGAPAPAPAPRFSATPAAAPVPSPPFGADTDAVLAEAGLDPERTAELRKIGVLG